MAAAPAIGVRRRFTPPPTARVDRSHPLAALLAGITWGAPPVSGSGFEVVRPTNHGGFYPTTIGPGVRGFGVETTNCARAWANIYPKAASLGNGRPLSLFAFVRVESTSEAGFFCGLGSTTAANSGVYLGVGTTTVDTAGNNLVALHAGRAWKASGVAIGTGLHSVAYVDDPGGVSFYIDGLRVATASAQDDDGGTPQFVTLAENAAATATPRSLSAGVVLAMAAGWQRSLSAAEVAMMHADPYCVLRY